MLLDDNMDFEYTKEEYDRAWEMGYDLDDKYDFELWLEIKD